MLVACVSGLGRFLSAQAPLEVPAKYKRLFYYYANNTNRYEKAVNSLGLPTRPVGRSFALIAGVTQYPNFSDEKDRFLKPAQVDIEKLKLYLKDQEFFDEIVVLKDGDMNLDTLNYFLENYFPEQLKKSPHARFLFAYSGHGYAESTADTARGFLLTSTATSKKDPDSRIDLSVLRSLLSPDIDAAEKTLVLINACQSGAFLTRRSFGDPLNTGDHGAHAIMASRKTQESLALASVGPGSVFFEKIFAALGGIADKEPADGIVTYRELDTYLLAEVPSATNYTQIPMDGDISRDGSVGQFFFLNRARQVQLGNSKPWNPADLVSFGPESASPFERGLTAYGQKRYFDAAEAFHEAADAGNTSAMRRLGDLYSVGEGVTQSYNQARQWYEKARARGDAGAVTDLAILIAYGKGGSHDFKQAFPLFEQAAQGGDGYAMYELADFLENGKGVTPDYAKSRYWLEQSAQAGEMRGMLMLGYTYYFGRHVPEDYKQSYAWFEKAAAAGSTTAMNVLGMQHEYGQGTPGDYKKASEWYERAAAGGDADSMYDLGYLYERGGPNLPQSYAQAREWYQKAADSGNNKALDRLKNLPR